MVKLVLVGSEDLVRYAVVVPSFDREFLAKVFDRIEVDDEDSVVGVEVPGVKFVVRALNREPRVENVFVSDEEGNLFVVEDEWEYSVVFSMNGRVFKLWLAEVEA